MAQTQSSANLKLINTVFAAMLVSMVGYFIYWGLGYTHYNHSGLFILATFFGVFMAFNVGGNDIANSFGTSVGSGTLTIPQALLIAAVFEVSGAVIAGGEVTDTIRKGIVDLNGHASGSDAVCLYYDVCAFGCGIVAAFCIAQRPAGFHDTCHYRAVSSAAPCVWRH